ncbi:acyltransferase [Priestia endophytica]|uniref:acyltransferase n=1 Tax=Priestia endophytica TaxID=135735 RepID=UPI002E1BE722|nr:acyltransferase [Priestia endophytica]
MLIYRWIKRKILLFETKRYKKLLRAEEKNLKFYGPVVIKNPEKIDIGYNCKVNDYAFLHGGGGLTIEDDVTISAFSKIISYGYNTNNWNENYLIKEHKSGPIHIGRGAWIGAGAIILPGVSIRGEGVIVAAGSIVTRDIDEDFVLVGGAPARVLKKYT